MQQITISGTLLSNAESCSDRTGRKYARFKVTCGDTDLQGRVQFTHYHCTCYLPNYDNLKKGDQVFITGKLSARISFDEDGKPYLNLNVMVFQACGGYKCDERKNPYK